MPENQGGQASTKAGTKAAIKSPRTRCSCSLAGYHDQRRIVPYAHDRTQFVASVVIVHRQLPRTSWVRFGRGSMTHTRVGRANATRDC